MALGLCVSALVLVPAAPAGAIPDVTAAAPSFTITMGGAGTNSIQICATATYRDPLILPVLLTSIAVEVDGQETYITGVQPIASANSSGVVVGPSATACTASFNVNHPSSTYAIKYGATAVGTNGILTFAARCEGAAVKLLGGGAIPIEGC